MPGSHVINAMLASADETDRASGARKLRTALTGAQGRIEQAATELGVSTRTVARWLARAELVEYAATLRAKHGHHDPRHGKPGNRGPAER